MSRRTEITQALIAQFNQISIANGYNTDLGVRGRVQRPVADSQQGAVLPFGLLTVPREDKSDEVVSNYFACTMTVELAVAPASAEDGFVEEDVEQIVEDCERVILAIKAQEPPLNINGVIDIDYTGHEKLPLRGDLVFCGAVLNMRVEYRHDVDDPRTYIGLGESTPSAPAVAPPVIDGAPVIVS